MSVWVSVSEWYAIVCLPPLASFPRACLPCPPTASDNPASLSDASRGLQEHHLSLSHEWLYLQGYRAFSETRKANLYNCLFLFMDKHEKKPGGIWAAQAWMSINNIMLAFFDRIWVSHTRLQLISVEHSKVDLLIKYWNSLLNKLDQIKQYGEERFGAVWNTESPTRPNWVTVNNAVDRSFVGSAGWRTSNHKGFVLFSQSSNYCGTTGVFGFRGSTVCQRPFLSVIRIHVQDVNQYSLFLKNLIMSPAFCYSSGLKSVITMMWIWEKTEKVLNLRLLLQVVKLLLLFFITNIVKVYFLLVLKTRVGLSCCLFLILTSVIS